MMKGQRYFWLIALLSVCVVTVSANSAHSLGEGDFDELEYHLLLQSVDSWDPVDGLPATLVDQLDEMLEFDDDFKHYKVMYVDTKDRALSEDTLILRVRARMDKPKKSKITLKSRSAHVSEVLALSECDDIKYEIDISGEPPGTTKNYSVSSDIKYHGIDDADLNVNAVTPASIFAYIQAECPDLYPYLAPLVGNPETQIPGIVDRYKFEGTLADATHPLYDEVEFDLELWVFAPDEYIVEIAFGGDAADQAALDALYAELRTFLAEDQGLLNPQSFSKTGFYFEFFPIPDVQPGDVFSYLITYTNLFEDDVYVHIFDQLNDLVNYENGSFMVSDELVSDPDFSGGLLDYEYSDPLGQNETLRIEFDVRVSDIASVGDIIENFAQVTAYTDPPLAPPDSDVDSVQTNFTRVEVVPEPSILLFLGTGLLGIFAFMRRKVK
ncbi:MAG: PEP-CTERM sorting domain-containing protein [bacterium]|nr:PEP-CTERM sorting domain-containing protein [bacterium]